MSQTACSFLGGVLGLAAGAVVDACAVVVAAAVVGGEAVVVAGAVVVAAAVVVTGAVAVAVAVVVVAAVVVVDAVVVVMACVVGLGAVATIDVVVGVIAAAIAAGAASAAAATRPAVASRTPIWLGIMATVRRTPGGASGGSLMHVAALAEKRFRMLAQQAMSMSRLALPAWVSQTGPLEKGVGHIEPALGIHSGAVVCQLLVIRCHHGRVE